MNASMIFYILGHVLRIEGVFMLLSATVGLIYNEKNGLVFLVMAICLFLLGLLLSAAASGKYQSRYSKQSCDLPELFHNRLLLTFVMPI